MHLIGITGFIGSGKTTIGQLLKDMGYVVFDMDVWCRKMYFEKVFLEVDAHQTKESLFAFQCDKLECDLQCKLYDQENCVDLKKQDNNEIMDDE